MKKIVFWEAVAALIGTIIGAGVFALPYITAKAGLGISFIWLIGLAAIVTYIHLAFGEIVLRTKEEYRLPGYVGHYLGLAAKKFLLITNFLTFGLSFVIYLILGSKFLSILLAPYHIAEMHLVLGLWIILSAIILLDSKAAARINFYISFALVGLFILLFFSSTPYIDKANFIFSTGMPWQWILPYGIFLYALIGFSAIPEAIKIGREGLMSGKHFKKVIILGSLVPVLLYGLFIIGVVGATGKFTTQEAISGLSNILGFKITILGALLGLAAVATSYLIFGSYLKNSFRCDYGWSKYFAYFLIALGPIIFYLLGIGDFTRWMSFIGALLTGFEGIMILYVLRQAKKSSNRVPEYQISLPKLIFWPLVICFVAGAILQVTLMI